MSEVQIWQTDIETAQKDVSYNFIRRLRRFFPLDLATS